MSAKHAALDRLIESVADGSPVDWQELEADAGNDAARRRVRDLRLVADVAAVHRVHTPDEPSDNDNSGASRDIEDGHGELERWGHLVLLERIGEGSFGTVYRAHDPWLDREVALKLLKPSAATSVATSRVLHEAQALARVRHSNVVIVHGADVHGGRVGLWMEFVRGRTLQQILSSQGSFGAAEAAMVGHELCRALAAVHAAGLVHRDIKATNVMREDGGRLVLMDFGAGRRLDLADTGPIELVGTPLYLAPELLAGGGATTRSDIYAVGVLLYYLVTGRYPVSAESVDELRAAHTRGEIRRASDVRPDLTEALVHVLEKALSPDPERRYASAGEMQTALSRVTEPESKAPARPFQWRRAGLIALAIVAAMLLAAAALWRGRDSPAPSVARGVALLAVLPFQNASTDPAEAYLATAVPMELTARLAQVGALKVVPWTFMKRFGGERQQALADVATETGADAVVEGTVQRVPGSDGSPGPVQVHVRIFAAGTGTMLWTASLERDLGDFFVVQAQIAREIASRLQIVPAARDQTLVSRSRQVPREAMEDYLNARQLLEINVNIPGAASLFRRAVERAPDFAEAYVGLAWCSALESAYLGSVPADAALRSSIDASDRAIQLDPEMPEGWAARGFARFALEGNWPAAQADLERALELGPASSDVLQTYSNYLSDRGRHAEAVQAALQAEGRAPLSVAASRQVAWAYYMARDYENAIRQAGRTLEIEPGYRPARTVLGRALLLSGKRTEGVAELEAAGREYVSMLAAGYAMAGRRDDALRLLNGILSPSYDGVVVAYEIAQIYAALGDQSHAIEWLEKAYARREAWTTEIAVDPMLDTLRANPRFQALLQKTESPR